MVAKLGAANKSTADNITEHLIVPADDITEISEEEEDVDKSHSHRRLRILLDQDRVSPASHLQHYLNMLNVQYRLGVL